MFKKFFAFALALAMLVSTAAFAEEYLGENEQIIALGTSGLTMVVDASYITGEITSEDTSESQVAYYYSETNSMDFDVYQWVRAEGETLEFVAADEAATYGVEYVATSFNDIPAIYYETVEEYDGVEYPTTTFILENGDVFVEIVFWMDGENPSDKIEAMVDSITAVSTADITDEGTEITLGTSSLKISSPYLYVQGEITAEDTDENQVAYYYSEETTVDFDVYQWAKAEGETLLDAVTEEAALYEAEIVETEINGIQLYYYEAVEDYEGLTYPTATFITEDGNDFVEIVFWLDGEIASDIVEALIDSITR